MKFQSALVVLTLVGSLCLFESRAAAQEESDSTTVIEFGPVQDVFPHPCTGEPIFYTLSAHLVLHQSTDENGGTHTTGQAVLRWDGESASGVQYHQRQVNTNNSNFTVGADNQTSPLTFFTVGQGEADDFYNHVIFHITFNANGEPTATVSEIRTECRQGCCGEE